MIQAPSSPPVVMREPDRAVVGLDLDDQRSEHVEPERPAALPVLRVLAPSGWRCDRRSSGRPPGRGSRRHHRGPPRHGRAGYAAAVIASCPPGGTPRSCWRRGHPRPAGQRRPERRRARPDRRSGAAVRRGGRRPTRPSPGTRPTGRRTIRRWTVRTVLTSKPARPNSRAPIPTSTMRAPSADARSPSPTVRPIPTASSTADAGAPSTAVACSARSPLSGSIVANPSFCTSARRAPLGSDTTTDAAPSRRAASAAA